MLTTYQLSLIVFPNTLMVHRGNLEHNSKHVLLQCYDKYLLKSLQKAAEVRGHLSWARAPENAGCYNSWPDKTGFFRDGGDYDSYYGRFFLKWYSKVLIDHGDRVLALANLAFEGCKIAAKVRTQCFNPSMTFVIAKHIITRRV